MRKHTHSPRPYWSVLILLLSLALVMGGVSPWATPLTARGMSGSLWGARALAGGGLGAGAAAQRTVPVPGNRLTLPRGARVLGPLPSGRPLRLIVGLAVRHAAVLAALLRAGRALPGSRPTLSPTQFAALFSPTPAAEEAVMAYLRAHGLRIVRTYPDRLLLDVAGTARQAEAAFDVPLVLYRDRHGRVFYANAAPLRLPAGVAGLVDTVVGLRDDVPLRHVPLPRLGRLRRGHGWTPRGQPAPPAGLLTPLQIQTAYDVTPAYSETFTTTTGLSETAAITGAGQTVAIYELSPYDPADVAAYDAAFGLAATPPLSVPVDGGATDPFGGTGAGEAALDIELVQAVAPGAHILVYSGPAAPNNADDTGADDTYARIVNDDRAQVLSTSWGQCEPDQLAAAPPDLTLLHNLFAQAVAEGMTVLAASGDGGANDCTDGRTNPSVDFPASDPYVIGVGGTALSVDAAGQVQSETAWGGSGGGASVVWPRPTWQAGPGVPAGGRRMVPDVALDAATSYAVWVAGGWNPVHGTSAGPPVWAALLALANEARYVAAEAQGAPTPVPCAMLPGLGDVHPELYQLGATPGPTPAMRDITAGTGNGVATPGPGWDGVTGWGVPDGYGLVRALIAAPALAAPAPRPCPTARSTAGASPTLTALPSPPALTPTPLASAVPPTRTQPTDTATLSPTATATPVRLVRPSHPSHPPLPAKASTLTVRAVPVRVHAGGLVLLQLRGAPGARHAVVFELRYPGRKPQRWRRATNVHGTAWVRVRVMHVLPGGRVMVVRLHATVRIGRRALDAWASFWILPASAARRAPPHPVAACSPEAHGHGVRGERLCELEAGQ